MLEISPHLQDFILFAIGSLHLSLMDPHSLGGGDGTGGGAIIGMLAAGFEKLHMESQKHTEKLSNIDVDQKRVNFAVKLLTDTFPPNIGVVIPSEDCKTDKSGKYRALMKALRLSEDNNVSSLATPIDPQEYRGAEFMFSWEDKNESESYVPFKEYLLNQFSLNAVILAEGAGLADRLLYVSDIFTLRPRISDLTSDLKRAALGQEPQFRFRIRGRTDLGVFKEDGVLGCGDLEMAFEVKPKSKFTSEADINRALREGVLQLIGTNADNHYTSPLVIVSALVGTKHYLLYIELGTNPNIELKYYLRVKSSTSIGQLIHYARALLGRGCVTSRFASPPTPTCTPPEGSPPEKGGKSIGDEQEEDDDEGFDCSNVSIESA